MQARRRSWIASVTLIAFAAMPAVAAGLNDTGVESCGDAFILVACATVSGDTGSAPRQDARYGRDAQAGAGQLVNAVNKIGAGSKGFDFTKIGNNGLPVTAALGVSPGEWACTRDNVTGLTWEVKTTSGLRSQSSTYSWYQTVSGNGVGTSNGGSCSAAGRCDTEKFVQDVNAARLCGYSNWRLPAVKELESIVDFGLFNPTIDVGYFPNTPTTNNWWTVTPAAGEPESLSWFVDFAGGGPGKEQFVVGLSVRLVRSTP